MIIVLERLINLLAMLASLWLAFYIVARGSTNRLTFRVFVLLIAVSFYYANVYLDTYAQPPMRGPYRSIGIMLGLTAGQNLSFYLLPDNLKRANQWIARGFVFFGIFSTVYLLGAAQISQGPCQMTLMIASLTYTNC